jgi:MoaA/NifB/PqqE/SkfB family radical SAM enzyme
MLSLLLHHFIPAWFYGGDTAFPALSKIDGELARCPSGPAAAKILEGRKADLHTRLSSRLGPALAQALTLKILNICLARYHLRARNSSVLSRPFGLVVDPSDVCRLACPGCVHSSRARTLNLFDWHNGTLSEDRFSALLKLYGPYAIGTYFCNYGEPLLNLKTPRLIRMAKNYLLWTALSTSLSVQRFDPEAYVESGLDFMVISIDGATQPVYERFRRNGNLQLVLDNLRQLVAAKHRLRRRTPVLSWNFLAFEHNAHEIRPAARLARGLGVNRFRVVNPFDVAWDDPDIRPAPLIGRVRRFGRPTRGGQAENWNPFPGSMETEAIARAYESPWDLAGACDEPPTPGHTCAWLYKNMVMDATGRILPCCGAPRPDTNLVFANFDGNRNPFNSEKYRHARSSFATDVPGFDGAPYCTQCEWDQSTVNIGGPEIRRYFRAADASFFDRRSLNLLSRW